MRQTSIEVYNQIRESGILSTRKMQVYSTLFEYGPLTQAELCNLLPEVSERSLTPRFAELLSMGAIQDAIERECRITGRNVIAWDVTSKFPTPLPKRINPAKVKKELVKNIEALGLKVEAHWKQPLREIWHLANSL